jgi:cytoskeletal protein CcmA (bactofilin family)
MAYFPEVLMWRKQDEPKASPPPPQPVAMPAPLAAMPAPHAPAPENRAASRLAASVSVRGEISAAEDLYVDGEIQGTIRVPDAMVTVGPKGRVAADIEARSIEVQGRVDGNLRAKERVALERTAVVTGEIVAPRVAVAEGADFRGQIETLRGESSPARAGAAVAGAGRAAPLLAQDSRG